MLHIKETIVVEGRYDKEKLKTVTDAPIICTGGFDLYKNKNTVKAICRMAEKTGVIILTDSDRAGFRIRSYIKQCTGGRGSVKHAYIPTVPGKERRKDKAGKEGILGVEGIDEETLAEILSRVAEVTDSAFGIGNAEGFIGADCADKANTDKCAQCADNPSAADCGDVGCSNCGGADCADKANTDKCAQCADNPGAADCRGADCADKTNTDKCAQCADNPNAADCCGASHTDTADNHNFTSRTNHTDNLNRASRAGNSNSAARVGGGNRGTVTSAMFYEDGFTGKDGSAELRARLAKQLGLPLRITPKAMLDIINKAYGVDEYKKAVEQIKEKK